MKESSKESKEIWMIEMIQRRTWNFIKALTFNAVLKVVSSLEVRSKELPLLEQSSENLTF
jgi:hypothetical protein